MLLLNGEIIDYKGKDPIAKLIKDYKQELIKEIGFPITFRFPDKLFVKKSDGLIESPCAQRLATKINTHSDRGAEEITYCERFWKDANDNVVTHPHKIVLDQALIVQERDWDLAVFLRYFYPKHGVSFSIVDSKAKNKARHEKELLETEVRTIIRTPKVVGISDSRLKNIAQAYGIMIEDETLESIQNHLWDIVTTEENRTKKGFNNFLDLMSKEHSLVIRSNVHKAIDIKLIENFADKGKTWAYVGDKGAMGDIITRYKTKENAVPELIEFYEKNKAAFDELMGLLGDKKVSI